MNTTENITKGQRVTNGRKTGTATVDQYTDGNLGQQCVSVLWDGGKRACPNFVRNLTVVK